LSNQRHGAIGCAMNVSFLLRFHPFHRRIVGIR
jgi:hypothetical protein